MPKKTKALAVRNVEVLPPAPKIPDARAAIEQLVEQKIAEIMGSGDAIFEPFFRSKEICREIRRLETVPMQRKWTYYFENFGCLICQKKDRPHVSLGMCNTCHARTAQRLAVPFAVRERRTRREEISRQARALHVEQGLTWREIAQRLDPDFAKNPKSAMKKMQARASRVSLVRDLQDVARKALSPRK
jgi:hypothetical protein